MAPSARPDPGAGRPDVSIVTSGHDLADARLHRVAGALGGAGLAVEVLGLGEAASAPPGAVVTATRRGGMVDRLRLAFRYARAARGRVIVALDPDSLLAAVVVGRLTGRAVVADVHEDYAMVLKDRAWATGWRGKAGAFVASAATRAAKLADLVVVADDHVPPHDASHRLVVRNLPTVAMLPEPTERAGTPRALYIGDVRSSRGLWSMVEAITEAPDWQLDVVGQVAPAEEDRLRSALASRRLDERIRLHGRKPPREAWQLASGAWCGLALLEDTPAFREALPSKLHEYLACGLAVVVTDLPRPAALVRESGAGAVVPAGPQTGSTAAAVLRRWADDPEELEAHRLAARAWRQQLLAGDPYAELAQRVSRLARR